jgi:hypothetical protein
MLYASYSHTSFSVEVFYASCRASRNSAADNTCYSSVLIKPNTPSRIWQSGHEPTRFRTIGARDTQRFHIEAALTIIPMRDNFSFVAKWFKLAFTIINPHSWDINQSTNNYIFFLLGFPVSKSKCWDGSQVSKLTLHASHVALPR